MITNPPPDQHQPTPTAKQPVARHLPILIAATLALALLVAASAPAQTVHAARPSARVRDSQATGLLAQRRLTRPARNEPPPALAITPVLLGLLALGVAIGAVSYARASRARADTRPPTALQITPIRQTPPITRTRVSSGPPITTHQERER